MLAAALLIAGSLVVVPGSPVAGADLVDAWSASQNLGSPSAELYGQRVGVSADGTRATAVWVRTDGPTDIVQGASATISGNQATWGPVTDLTGLGWNARDLTIAVSADGSRATAVWVRYNDSAQVVQAASGVVNGTTAAWGEVHNISSYSPSAEFPRLGLSSDGSRATAVWTRFDGASFVIESASAVIAGPLANWSAAANRSGVGQKAGLPDVAVSADGTRAGAIWALGEGMGRVVQASTATIAGNVATWGPITDLTPPALTPGIGRPHIGMSTDGSHTTAVWPVWNGATGLIEAASATVSGNVAQWGARVDLTTGQEAMDPQLALSAHGDRAIAVWRAWTGQSFVVRAATASVSANWGTWGVSVDVSDPARYGGQPRVAISADGRRASAAWTIAEAAAPTESHAQAASATISGATHNWGATTNLTAPGEVAIDPQLGVSADGSRTTAVWERWTHPTSIVQTASMIKVPTPTATAATPATGPASGGTLITIGGSGFAVAPTSVKVGGNACTELAVAQDTSLACRTPAGTAGPVDVQVTTMAGSATLPGGFTYIGAALTPTFATPFSGNGGFTAQIVNYSPAFTWAAVPTAGTANIDGAGLLTVTGLGAGQSATVTVGTSRTYHEAASAQVTGSAAPAPMLDASATAVSRKGKFRLTVITPCSSQFKFRVQKRYLRTIRTSKAKPVKVVAWKHTGKKSYRTKGRGTPKTATLNFPKGVYRAVVSSSCGYLGITTNEVTLKR